MANDVTKPGVFLAKEDGEELLKAHSSFMLGQNRVRRLKGALDVAQSDLFDLQAALDTLFGKLNEKYGINVANCVIDPKTYELKPRGPQQAPQVINNAVVPPAKTEIN